MDSIFWQPNQGEHNGAPHDQPDGVPYQVGGGNSPWFLWKTVTTPGIPAVIEHTYTLHIDAVTCPEPGPETCPEGTDNVGQEIPQGQTAEEFCSDPVVEDGKKVVVCKYVGTPPGTPDHIIVVSVNSLDNFPENPVFPLTLGTRRTPLPSGSRWATSSPVTRSSSTARRSRSPVCPEGTDHAGEEVPEGETEESFCNDEEPPAVCPEGTDNAGQEIPDGETAEEFCSDPVVEDGKKVVVCKYVGTPPGTPDHIIVVSVNSLDNFPENPVFPLTFGDAQESIAIRFAVGNEQPGDEELVNCPVEEEPEVCPEGTDKAGQEIPEGQTEESFCDVPDEDPGPDTCPQGTDKAGQEIPRVRPRRSSATRTSSRPFAGGHDKAGEEIPEGQTEEEFCDEDEQPAVCPEGTDKAGEEIPEGESEEEFCDEDDEEEVCPEGTDHAGEEVPGGESKQEFCDDDDPGPNCEEDPSQEKCDEDKPPVVVPDNGTTPDSGPTVKGAQATAPTTVAGAVAGTPAARVPTAVNAGLAPEQLADNGGALGLLGIAAALLGAALVGLTVRPKRRVGAALRART